MDLIIHKDLLTMYKKLFDKVIYRKMPNNKYIDFVEIIKVIPIKQSLAKELIHYRQLKALLAVNQVEEDKVKEI